MEDDLLDFASDQMFGGEGDASPKIKKKDDVNGGHKQETDSRLQQQGVKRKQQDGSSSPVKTSPKQPHTNGDARRLPSWMSKPSAQKQQPQRPLNERVAKKSKQIESIVVSPAWMNELQGFTEIEAPIKTGRVICFDLETSGFGPEDTIIEIGAVELIDGCRTGLTFQSYAKPKGPIHPCAEQVHQLSSFLLMQSPPIEVVLASFMDFVGDSLLVAHNLAFDRRMLIQELMRAGIPIKPNHQILLDHMDHIVLTTRDLDSCVKFYCDVLGLEKHVFNGSRVALKFGNQKINVHVAGAEVKPHATHPTPGGLDLCFISTRPILQVLRRMFSMGVAVEEGPVPRTGATHKLLSIYLRDPDAVAMTTPAAK
eukprot:gene17205-20504_t